MSISYKGTTSEDVRKLQICVNSCSKRDISGIIYHQTISEGRCFDNMMQLVILIEQLLQEIEYPREMQERRSFSSSMMPLLTASGNGRQQGALATFDVRMTFRQNASWQGIITWREGEREVSFRSALEFLLLIDSALYTI